MAFLKSINEIRSITWGGTYLWDIHLEGAPSPFESWFPATDVDEAVASLSSHMIQSPLSNHVIPFKGSDRKVSVTFIDDENYTLHNWIANWINVTILNNGKGISTLAKAVKKMTIEKLRRDKTTVKRTSYWVYPEGEFKFVGTSDTKTPTYSVMFVVVGIVGDTKEKETT